MRCRYNNMRLLSRRELSDRGPSRLPGLTTRDAQARYIISRRFLRRYRAATRFREEEHSGDSTVRRNGVTVIVWKKSDSADRRLARDCDQQVVAPASHVCMSARVHKCTRTHVHAHTIALLVESSLPVSHTSYYEKYLLPHRRTFRLALCPLITYLNGSTRTRDDPHDWITCSEASTRPRL